MLKEAVRLLQREASSTNKPVRAKKSAAAAATHLEDAASPPSTLATELPPLPPATTTKVEVTVTDASVKEDRVNRDVKEMVKRALLALRGPADATVTPDAANSNWQARLKKLMRQDDVAWVDRLLASNVAKRLPSETDWDRLLEQTKNLSKEVKEVKVKKWLAEHKAVAWLQTRLEKLNTVNPKVEWEQVLTRLKAIPPGILSLDHVRTLQQQSKTLDGDAQVNRKQLEWMAKVAARLAKNQAKRKVNLPEVPAPTKYPIVLAHGLGGDKPFLKCFMGIPEDLKPLGVPVYTPKVARYGTVFARAETLKEQIMQVLEETRAPKVNIIGHSMGGLDARHFISNLGGHEVTASLTTLGTPHRGSSYSDWIIAMTDAIGLERLFQAQILPFPMEGHHHVTPKFMKDVFNPQTPDHPDVAYFSMGGSKKIARTHPLFICQRILSKYEGLENDGLVSVESSKWGEYLETLDMDHAAMINWSYQYDARELYRRLVNLLRDKGF